MQHETAHARRMLLLLSLLLAAVTGARADTCDVTVSGGSLATGDGTQNLCVNGSLTVSAGNTYRYRQVHIIGTLQFLDDSTTSDTVFWAQSILVESGGVLQAGTKASPFGASSRRRLIFNIYGATTDEPIACYLSGATCGVESAAWNSPTVMTFTGTKGSVQDTFYGYQTMPFSTGYFGLKALAVSFGGSLRLYGSQGVDQSLSNDWRTPSSGKSWVRLAQDMQVGSTDVYLSSGVDWYAGAELIITSTDFLANHTERFTIESVVSSTQLKVSPPARFHHFGQLLDFSARIPSRLGIENTTVELRAAVGLLTRSIMILGAGATIDTFLPDGCLKNPQSQCCSYYADPGVCSFGAHVIVRQGFREFVLSGVQLSHCGQGGIMGRYPAHLHLTRNTSYTNALVADCSIHDSMTRFVTLHGTSNVQVYRNVGYRSIGHGFYLEDGVETMNELVSNLGALLRSGVYSPGINDRSTPGILAKNYSGDPLVFSSDNLFPVGVWISNPYNYIVGNKIAGTTLCGSCFWWLPMRMSGASLLQTWSGYANRLRTCKGCVPTLVFRDNECSSSMNVLQTSKPSNCPSVSANNAPTGYDPKQDTQRFYAIINVLANQADNSYFPNVDDNLAATVLNPINPGGCTGLSSTTQQDCLFDVVDGLRAAWVGWTDTNFAAIWLREGFFIAERIVLANILTGGISMITAGDYTGSIPKVWSTTRHSIFIGDVWQNSNPYARQAGPVNSGTPLQCNRTHVNYCAVMDQAWVIDLANFGFFQRFFNIYDGPTYQSDNAYLDIPVGNAPCNKPANGACVVSGNETFIWNNVQPIPKDANGNCFMPNCAVGWKQPNGFYYPPMFVHENLFFSNVTIRHWVFEPEDNVTKLPEKFCTFGSTIFSASYTDVDRQTIINDFDGSVTGIVGSSSINKGKFFRTPLNVAECASEQIVDASPYRYVSAALWPPCNTAPNTNNKCGSSPPQAPNDMNGVWDAECTSAFCFGPRIYRMNLLPDESESALPTISLMGTATGQRSSLVLDFGAFYLDTSPSKDVQTAAIDATGSPQPKKYSVFQASKTYFMYFLYTTGQSALRWYVFVGRDASYDPNTAIGLIRTSYPLPPTLSYTDVSNSQALRVSYNASTGIATIDVDFSAFQSEYNVAADLCGPSAWCGMNSGSCRCNLSSSDPNYSLCSSRRGSDQNDICGYSVLNTECPQHGCYGFRFQMASTFVADNSAVPPKSTCFVQGSRLDIKPQLASQEIAGADCYYSSSPFNREGFCQSCSARAFAPGYCSAASASSDYAAHTALRIALLALAGTLILLLGTL